MAGEQKWFYGSTKNLETNGAAVNSDAFAAADDADLASADTGDYPHADFVLTVNYSVAPAAGLTVDLYAQPKDIDGTTDAPTPGANFKSRYIGSFLLNAATGAQTLAIQAFNIPKNAGYHIHNRGGQTIQAGWTLKATPKSVGPA